MRIALENAKKAYGRLTNGKPATKVLDDKKLHKEVKQAAESLRDAGQALREGPKKKKRSAAGSPSCCSSPSSAPARPSP